MPDSKANIKNTKTMPTLAETACRSVGQRITFNGPTITRDNSAVSVFQGKDGQTGILFENYSKSLGTNYQCIVDGEIPKCYNDNSDDSKRNNPDEIRKTVEIGKIMFGNHITAVTKRFLGKILNSMTDYTPNFKPATE